MILTSQKRAAPLRRGFLALGVGMSLSLGVVGCGANIENGAETSRSPGAGSTGSPSGGNTSYGPLSALAPENAAALPNGKRWQRICKGKNAVTRFAASVSSDSAGTWSSETPFLVESVSENGEWILGTRAHDGKKAWVAKADSCDLDSRRRVCEASRTDLFWANSSDQKSGRFVYENEIVTLDGAEANSMTRVVVKDTKYWMWSSYLCPVDPNIAPASGPGGAEGAFFATIAHAEGTRDRYNLTFGFRTFSSYADHPRMVICSGGLCSSAAGRYQILDKTWDGIRRGLSDFSPRNQDEAARRLIRNRGVRDITARMDYGTFTANIYKLNREWASLPGSPYGQPTKSMSELWNLYSSR